MPSSRFRVLSMTIFRNGNKISFNVPLFKRESTSSSIPGMKDVLCWGSMQPPYQYLQGCPRTTDLRFSIPITQLCRISCLRATILYTPHHRTPHILRRVWRKNVLPFASSQISRSEVFDTSDECRTWGSVNIRRWCFSVWVIQNVRYNPHWRSTPVMTRDIQQFAEDERNLIRLMMVLDCGKHIWWWYLPPLFRGVGIMFDYLSGTLRWNMRFWSHICQVLVLIFTAYRPTWSRVESSAIVQRFARYSLKAIRH